MVSHCYSRDRGRFLTCYAPVRHSIFPGVATDRISFDLHVLSTPPAFVLSQDQTLRQDLGWQAEPTNVDRRAGPCGPTGTIASPGKTGGCAELTCDRAANCLATDRPHWRSFVLSSVFKEQHKLEARVSHEAEVPLWLITYGSGLSSPTGVYRTGVSRTMAVGPTQGGPWLRIGGAQSGFT